MNGGAFTTVISPSTSVTLQGLMANTEYSVSVAAMNSSGVISAFTGPTQFVLQGDLSSYLCSDVLLHNFIGKECVYSNNTTDV